MVSQKTVDVVIDLPTAQLAEAFTYSVGDQSPVIGSRVKVRFRGRSVSGWVVRSSDSSTNGVTNLKPVDDVLEDLPLPAHAIELAEWIHRRYLCTFREALNTVSSRRPAEKQHFSFVRPPASGDAFALALHRRFSGRMFSALGARRALSTPRARVALKDIQSNLRRLVREGLIERLTLKLPVSRAKIASDATVVLVDASAASGVAQRRLASALSDAAGTLPYADLKSRASIGTAVIRKAVQAGVVRLDQRQQPHILPARPETQAHRPTEEQHIAIERIDAAMQGGYTAALLHGVTGSGKTLVYARLVDRVRKRGGQAVILVPEIALTPQTAGRFVAVFGEKVGVLHSGLSAKERAGVWQAAASGALDVVVGARSAVFAPLERLRLIVVDEEHEPSYKQDVAPRYDAAAVAAQRMKLAGGAIVLGSATPSLEAYSEALNGQLMHVRLERRATSAPLPAVEIVNMGEHAGGKRTPLGPVLSAAIESNLRMQRKVLLFVNRRGYAGLLLCRSCGFAPRCHRCAVSLVMHSADQSMRCHICGDAFKIAGRCPKCGSPDLRPYGFGTQRVEEEVRRLFPSAGIVRMDSDSTSALGAHAKLLRAFEDSGDILIGTQMIAKGLDYPAVTLVGVVAADLDLNRPDFRAAERTFALLTQVAGRAGRAAPGSRVIVQTFSPDHYAIRLAAKHDYESFARKELSLRKELRYPPFGRLAYLILRGTKLEDVDKQARSLADHLRSTRTVEVLGPAPDTLPKARGEYHMRITLKSQSEEALLAAGALAQRHRVSSNVRLTTVVDPR